MSPAFVSGQSSLSALIRVIESCNKPFVYFYSIYGHFIYRQSISIPINTIGHKQSNEEKLLLIFSRSHNASVRILYAFVSAIDSSTRYCRIPANLCHGKTSVYCYANLVAHTDVFIIDIRICFWKCIRPLPDYSIPRLASYRWTFLCAVQCTHKQPNGHGNWSKIEREHRTAQRIVFVRSILLGIHLWDNIY